MNEISNINDLRAKATQGDIFAQKQLSMLLIRSDETLREGVSWLERQQQQIPTPCTCWVRLI